MKKHKINYKKYITLFTALTITMVGAATVSEIVNSNSDVKYDVVTVDSSKYLTELVPGVHIIKMDQALANSIDHHTNVAPISTNRLEGALDGILFYLEDDPQVYGLKRMNEYLKISGFISNDKSALISAEVLNDSEGLDGDLFVAATGVKDWYGMQYLDNVEYLTIYRPDIDENTDFTYIAEMKNLKEVSLNMAGTYDIQQVLESLSVFKNSNVESLNISMSGMKSEDLLLLSELDNVKHLGLSGQNGLGQHPSVDIDNLDFINEMKSLEHITINGNSIENVDVATDKGVSTLLSNSEIYTQKTVEATEHLNENGDLVIPFSAIYDKKNGSTITLSNSPTFGESENNAFVSIGLLDDTFMKETYPESDVESSKFYSDSGAYVQGETLVIPKEAVESRNGKKIVLGLNFVEFMADNTYFNSQLDKFRYTPIDEQHSRGEVADKSTMDIDPVRGLNPELSTNTDRWGMVYFEVNFPKAVEQSTPELTAEPLKIATENRDFKGLEELIYEAYDTKDGNLNSSVIIKSGTVNISKIGRYSLILEVTNSDGNVAEEEVIVEVFEVAEPEVVVEAEPEIVVEPEVEVEKPEAETEVVEPDVEKEEVVIVEEPEIIVEEVEKEEVVVEEEIIVEVEKEEVTSDPKVEPEVEPETAKEQPKKEVVTAIVEEEIKVADNPVVTSDPKKEEPEIVEDVEVEDVKVATEESKKDSPKALLQTDITDINQGAKNFIGLFTAASGIYLFKIIRKRK